VRTKKAERKFNRKMQSSGTIEMTSKLKTYKGGGALIEGTVSTITRESKV
tara:strand:+ start:209 stop:358 length:150 start_codon:yes stop_codon:yes gene_type:complete